MTSTHAQSLNAIPRQAKLPTAIVIATAIAIVGDLIVAAVAHAAGASSQFKPLLVSSFAPLTIVGLVCAAIAWTMVRARATDPWRVLSRLIPIVVLISLIPDIAVGVSKSQAHTTWGAVIALMVMHLAVSAAGVTTFSIVLPVRRSAPPTN
jgi:cytochrome bd-type quinol oxidase subunit 2